MRFTLTMNEGCYEQRRILAYLESFSLTQELRQAWMASLPAHAFGRLQSQTQEAVDALITIPQGDDIRAATMLSFMCFPCFTTAKKQNNSIL